MTTNGPMLSHPAAPPDPAKDAAKLLHAQLELMTWHLGIVYAPADSATVQMLADSRALLTLTRTIAGRDAAE